MESEQRITGVDIGNNGSAFVEILVGKSSSDNVMENLINSTALMSPSESRSQSNFYKIKMFSKQDLCKVSLDGKWDKVKVVCSQPYNKIIKFGLSMITFHGEPSTPKRPPTQPTIHLPKKISNSSPKTPQRSTGTPSSNGERKAASKLLAGVTLNKEDVSQQALNDLKEKGGTKTASSIVSKVIDVSELPKPSRTSSQNKSSSSSSHSDNKPSSSGADRFETLLSGVVIVISGYQNPLRSDIRQLALSMGASYRPDWNSQATHLICAVPNTPKYNHVKGRGIIVKKEWIFACRDKRQRVSETKYRMDLDKSDSESEDNSDNERESIDEDRDDAEVSITAKGKRKKKGNIKYQDSSSESEDAIPSKKMKRDNEDSYHPSDDEMEDEEDAEFYENVPSDEGDSSSHGDNDNSETSENDNASSKKKKIRKPSKKDAIKLPDISDSEDEKEGDIYEAETDAETEDDIIERLQLPPLPNFFAGFYVLEFLRAISRTSSSNLSLG